MAAVHRRVERTRNAMLLTFAFAFTVRIQHLPARYVDGEHSYSVERSLSLVIYFRETKEWQIPRTESRSRTRCSYSRCSLFARPQRRNANPRKANIATALSRVIYTPSPYTEEMRKFNDRAGPFNKNSTRNYIGTAMRLAYLRGSQTVTCPTSRRAIYRSKMTWSYGDTATSSQIF